MEEQQHSPDLHNPYGIICTNCRSQPAMANTPNNLCHDCREAFVRYPVPQWVIAFGVGVLAVLIIGMFSARNYIATAFDYSRGMKAIDNKQYITARNHLDKVLALYPDHVNARAYALIAACYNEDLVRVKELYMGLRSYNIDDDGLIKSMGTALSFASQMQGADSASVTMVNSQLNDSSVDYKTITASLDTMEAENKLTLYYLVADHLFDKGAYAQCQDMLDTMFSISSDSYLAEYLQVAVYRRQKNYDAALKICDQMLTMNHENVGVLGQKAKIELLKRNKAAAAQYADRAYALDKNNTSAKEAKALVAHYNGKTAERDKLLAEMKASATPADSIVYNRTLDIVTGKQELR